LILRRADHPSSVADKDLHTACVAAISADADNPYLYYFLGDCESRLGESDLAAGAFRRSMDLDATWSAPAVRLVEILLQKGRPDQAFEVASIAIHHSPSSAVAVIALARAWSAGIESGSVGKADELLNLVGQIQKQLPTEDRLPLIAIQLLAQQGKKGDAILKARDALQRTPAPAEQFFLTLATMSRKFDLGVEQECFDKSMQAHGISPMLALTEAVDSFITGHTADEATAVFDRLAAQSGKAPDAMWKLSRAKCLDLTVSTQARSAWLELRDAYPNDPAIQQAVVSGQTVQADWDVVQPAINHLRALSGDNGLTWRLAQARLMVESPRSEDDYEKAAVQLNNLIEQYPQLPEAHVLLARALVQIKRLDGAIQQFSTAAQLDPTNVTTSLQLAALLQSEGDFQRVQQELDRIAPQLQSDAQRQQAAVLLARQGESERAAKLLAQPTKPGDVNLEQNKSDLFLAYLYRQRNEYDRAEAIVVKLMDHPDLATVQFAASLYTAEGKPDQAKQAISKLDTLKLDPGIKELVLASHAAETGDLEQAAKYYSAAAAKNPSNTVAWQLLAACQMGTGRLDASAATLASAAAAVPTDKGLQLLHQQSPLLRSASADLQLRPIAISVLRDPLNSDTNLEILRTVVANWDSNDREQLSSRLQDIIDRHPESLDARLQLVLCYQSMGRYADAMTVARQAMDAFPQDSSVARYAVNICESARRWKDLESVAEVLKRRSPGDAATADVAIAMSQVSQGLSSAAIEQLSPYLPAATAHPDQYADLLSLYAFALASNGHAQEAADLMWPFVGTSQSWRQRWISVARDLPDAHDASAWLDRLAGVLGPDDVAGRAALADAYSAVGKRANDPGLLKKSSDLFAYVSQSPAADPNSLLIAGVHAEARGEWATAEADYRQALAKNPSLFPADNNLAMLIVKHGGDLHEAVALAQKAIDLQPRIATLYDSLAAAHHALGNAQVAVDEESIAIRLDPDTLDWKIRSAAYQLDAGNAAAAARIIQDLDLKGLDSQSLSRPLQQQLDLIRTRLKNNKLS
jgi:predicted Zn-dependent protease